ncbi:MAG: HD domain-containing protein [candidate division Zixibacteria bacterium]|nr:HD domain-containing protein [candidate division Zixibacteria bacterium]
METMANRQSQLEIASRDEHALVSLLFILLKTARFVDANNATYLTQSSKFYVVFRRLVDEHGKVSIKIIDGRVFVRDKIIKFNSDGLVDATAILDSWRQIGVGGVTFDDSLDNRQLDKFIYLIAKGSGVKTDRESVIKRLSDLGIEGVSLMGIERKVEKKLLSEQKRKLIRRTARVTFFKSISVVQDAMVCAKQDKDIDITKARRVVHSMIDQIAGNESYMIQLTSIRDFDDHTYAHCSNVCVYSLTMGVRLGFDKYRLSQLGMAALFHDIGKVSLPGDLIRKPDAFNEDDWIQMQRHPELGAKTVLRNLKFDDYSARAARAAFEHHINDDFTGYPVLREKVQTNLFSKIIAIADTFDALTSGRVYIKKAIPTDEVLRKMMYQMTVKFDAFLLKMFVNIIGIYPAGTLVLLSSEELALVTKNNQKNLSRPQIKIIGDSSGPKKEFIPVDLSQSKHAGISIQKIIDPGKHNIDMKTILQMDN